MEFTLATEVLELDQEPYMPVAPVLNKEVVDGEQSVVDPYMVPAVGKESTVKVIESFTDAQYADLHIILVTPGKLLCITALSAWEDTIDAVVVLVDSHIIDVDVSRNTMLLPEHTLWLPIIAPIDEIVRTLIVSEAK